MTADEIFNEIEDQVVELCNEFQRPQSVRIGATVYDILVEADGKPLSIYSSAGPLGVILDLTLSPQAIVVTECQANGLEKARMRAL